MSILLLGLALASALREPPASSITERVFVTTPIEKLVLAADAAEEVLQLHNHSLRLKRAARPGSAAAACLAPAPTDFDAMREDILESTAVLRTALVQDDHPTADAAFRDIGKALDAARSLQRSMGACLRGGNEDTSTNG